MLLQAILTVIHILSAVVWLGLVPADLVLRKNIKRSRGLAPEKKLISVYLHLVNITGIIGMTGIVITGVILTSILPYYQFFNFSINHWLVTKQVIMVILIVLVFALLIPKAKKVRLALGADTEGRTSLGEEVYGNLGRLETIITIINVLVLINFLLAVTHRFIY
ncbi:MAG: hypothetical protein HF308_05255 [Ignavibacteria bacterium]|jgi:hypothetical protein|nr:hypothetical protein [Ignavibacteria bacterium]MCU7520739.1 hypothetical protein [Ignavibacteria bacterium]MCU7523861.1 hypothetical protein [Ignavibacteria bacterium]